MPSIINLAEAEKYLATFYNLESGNLNQLNRVYRLERMHLLLALFGHPQNSFKSIHLAGSKGKGSTACFFASALKASGFKTGLYTSPHLLDLRERIQINQKPIEIKLFLELLEKIRFYLEENKDTKINFKPSFFEILTLLAFLAFQATRCEYAVIETGLGGRLDATNTITPVFSIITPIELEHQDILGYKLEEIAFEKGGIIKSSAPVFCSKQPAPVKNVLRKIASEKKTPIYFLDEELEFLEVKNSLNSSLANLKLKNTKPFSFRLKFKGYWQAENASLVLLAFQKMLANLKTKKIIKGLAKAILPGRLMVLKKKPLVLADVAHTPGSIKCLIDFLLEKTKKPRLLIFAASSGKKYEEMASILGSHFERIIITRPGSLRLSEPEIVYQSFKKYNLATSYEENPEKALKAALKQINKNWTLVITGSFYLLAEVINILKNYKLLKSQADF